MSSLKEFRRHKETTNPAYVIGFLTQWKMYLDEIPKDKESGSQWKGRRLDPTIFEKVSAVKDNGKQHSNSSANRCRTNN